MLLSVTKLIVVISSMLVMSSLALPSRTKNEMRLCNTHNDCQLNEICMAHVCQDKYQEGDSETMKENYCLSSHECEPMYACNMKTFKCELITRLDQIMQKQQCRNVFKRRCTMTSHCACNERSMVCEQNECVYEKKKSNNRCRAHSDCQIAYLCDKGNCREARSEKELELIFQQSFEVSFQYKGEHHKPDATQCKNGKCKRETVSTKKERNECLFQTVGKHCFTNDECKNSCGKHTNAMMCSNNKCKMRFTTVQWMKTKRKTDFSIRT